MQIEEQIDRLMRLGLNAYEAKAYAGLLTRDSFTATQIADVSGVPRQRIYDILASLIERGMVISRPLRRGTRYMAVAPRVALNGLIERERERVNYLQSTTDDLVVALMPRYEHSQIASGRLDALEILRGNTAITRRFGELRAGCRREILMLVGARDAGEPWGDAAAGEDDGPPVRACSIYETGVLAWPESLKRLHAARRRGERMRFIDQLPLRLAIVDEEVVCFAIEDPIAGRSSRTIMVVKDIRLAGLLKLAFETLWGDGTTFAAACERLGMRADDLDTREEDVPHQRAHGDG